MGRMAWARALYASWCVRCLIQSRALFGFITDDAVPFLFYQHVYGTAIGVHGRNPKKFQHQGLGQLLMEEAERIAREEHDSWKLAVISGIGTRDYYRRLGYELDGVYMSKVLV